APGRAPRAATDPPSPPAPAPAAPLRLAGLAGTGLVGSGRVVGTGLLALGLLLRPQLRLQLGQRVVVARLVLVASCVRALAGDLLAVDVDHAAPPTAAAAGA